MKKLSSKEQESFIRFMNNDDKMWKEITTKLPLLYLELTWGDNGQVKKLVLKDKKTKEIIGVITNKKQIKKIVSWSKKSCWCCGRRLLKICGELFCVGGKKIGRECKYVKGKCKMDGNKCKMDGNCKGEAINEKLERN